MNEDDDENRDENGFPFFGNVKDLNKNNNFNNNKNINFNNNNKNNNNNNIFNNNNNNKKNKQPAKPPGKKGKKSYMVREGEKMLKGRGYGYLNSKRK